MDDSNKSNTIWQEPPSQPILANNRVHVWRTSLNLPLTLSPLTLRVQREILDSSAAN